MCNKVWKFHLLFFFVFELFPTGHWAFPAASLRRVCGATMLLILCNIFSSRKKPFQSWRDKNTRGRQRVFCLELAAAVNLALLFTPLDKHESLPCSPRSCWFCEFSVYIGAESHQFRIQEQSGMGLIYLSLGEKEDNARIMSQTTPKSEEGRLTEASPWPFYAYMHTCMYI